MHGKKKVQVRDLVSKNSLLTGVGDSWELEDSFVLILRLPQLESRLQFYIIRKVLLDDLGAWSFENIVHLLSTNTVDNARLVPF
jgi:hypothetical protein